MYPAAGLRMDVLDYVEGERRGAGARVLSASDEPSDSKYHHNPCYGGSHGKQAVNKGNTYKLLCTLQEKGAIFFNKLLLGSLYMLCFACLQLCLVAFLGWRYRIPQEWPAGQAGYFFVATFVTSVVLLLLQEILSLRMENQLYPLFIGLIGTFAGLFSWFFPNLPLRYVIPWGYYCVGCTINMEAWDRETRIVRLYAIPFPYLNFALFLLFALLLYLYGRNLFLKREV